MKKLLLSALFLLPVLAQAQTENFVMRGTVGPKSNVTKAYIRYPVNKVWQVDSAAVKNGHFEFRGTLPEPVRAIFTLSHSGTPLAESQDMRREIFYLEQGVLVVSTPDSATKATIRGTPLNDENTSLNALLKPLRDQANALTKAAATQPDAQVKQLEARLAALGAAQDKVQANYVKTHPDAHFSLFVLFDLLTSTSEVGTYAALYQSLSADLRNTPRGQRIGEQIKGLQKVAVGVMAPDFTQNTPDNIPLKLSSLRGKYVLLDFWASWCGPCRQENPNVVKAYNTFKDKGFTVLGVSLDKENAREAWVRAIKQDGLTWPQVSDLQYWNNAAAQAYGVNSVPQNFLLDPQGKIVAVNLRGEALQSTLSKLLNATN